MRDLVVYGTGGMGREVAELLQAGGERQACWRLLGFIDDQPGRCGTQVDDLPVLGTGEWLERRSTVAVAVAIGSPEVRRRIFGALRASGRHRLPTLVHPAAVVGSRAEIGAGSIVGAGAVLTTDVHVGEAVIINVGATVSHDDVLCDYATLAPGVHLAGAVTVEEGADIGIGASVIPGRTVGAWSIVGAGAAVIEDVPRGATVVGCPARVVSMRSVGEAESALGGGHHEP